MMDPARRAYETLAPAYDEFTRTNDYEMWLGDLLLPELEGHGLTAGRALDAGCGTGRAFEPLLRRGWEVVGCDVSPAMLAEARRKFGEAVPLTIADLRGMPVLGRFDLVIALNDVVNYLTGDGDLERALTAMAANLAPGGFVLFDSNTLATFRSEYLEAARAGGIFETTIATADIEPHVHRQRHFTDGDLVAAIAAAGLEQLALLGQRETKARVELHRHADQERDRKVICIARSGRG